jgi:hypothetical protein
MEFLTATKELKKFFKQLEMFDVCTTGDTAHIDMLSKFLPHTCQHGKNLNIATDISSDSLSNFGKPILRQAFYSVGGHAVAQLFETLCYKPEGRGFDSR